MAKKVKENMNNELSSVKESKDSNPYEVIKEFFSAASLEHYQQYISSMLKAAYSEEYWTKSSPANLLHFQERMIELIRATYLFVKNGDGIKKKKKALMDDSVFENGLSTVAYYGWHHNKTMWEFFPRNLNREEFLNPYKVYERFFEYKEIQIWVKEFKELISYALESFGNETGIDFDYLEIHRQLQKLVEASHLIEVRVNMPKRSLAPKPPPADEMKKEDIVETEPSEEIENYTSDPYQVIDQYFLDGTIEDGRDDLERFFGAAFPDDLVSKKHYPTLLVYIYERIDKLIDAAFTINHESKAEVNTDGGGSDNLIIHQIKTLFRKLEDWDTFPCKLKPAEWVNPRLAIRAFFEHQPLSHWKGKLHEFLQASIRDESICSVISDRSKLYLDCLHLERLVEAMWVIKVLELA
jgi:hypothetical protein